MGNQQVRNRQLICTMWVLGPLNERDNHRILRKTMVEDLKSMLWNVFRKIGSRTFPMWAWSSFQLLETRCQDATCSFSGSPWWVAVLLWGRYGEAPSCKGETLVGGTSLMGECWVSRKRRNGWTMLRKVWKEGIRGRMCQLRLLRKIGLARSG